VQKAKIPATAEAVKIIDTTRFSVVVAQFRNYYWIKFGLPDPTGFSLVEFSTS
jgi:hypothetical protein